LLVSLWVLFGFVLEELEFFFEAPAVEGLAETVEDGVQPWVSGNDVTKALLVVAKEFKCKGRTPSFALIWRWGWGAEILVGG
jgi:hypothetical protein